jgi:hypothetical protein
MLSVEGWSKVFRSGFNTNSKEGREVMKEEMMVMKEGQKEGYEGRMERRL